MPESHKKIGDLDRMAESRRKDRGFGHNIGEPPKARGSGHDAGEPLER